MIEYFLSLPKNDAPGRLHRASAASFEAILTAVSAARLMAYDTILDMPVAVPELDKARTTLDAWVRELMQWHFSPETGCPFWLQWAEKAGWDPRKEIKTYDDLDKFGLFQDEWLRGGPVRRWVPKAYAGQADLHVRDRRQHRRAEVAHQHRRLPHRLRDCSATRCRTTSFPKGADWLMVGPSGPRRLRLAIEHLAQHRGGICFMVDLDPRWVIKLIKMGEMEMMELYKRHVIDQALTLLKAHDNIKCLFTTPKLLEALCERISLKKAGITGVFCGGTEMTPQFHRFAVEELMEGALLRADLRQHADGPRPRTSRRPRKTTGRSSITRRRRAR